MIDRVWERLEFDIADTLGFNVKNLFDIDIFKVSNGSYVLHIDNYSDSRIEIAIIFTIRATGLPKKGNVIRARQISKRSIPANVKSVKIYWRKNK